MKKKLLALLSLFLALVVFFSPCICSLNKVSAEDININGFSFPDAVYFDSSFRSTADDIYDKLKSNDSFTALGECIVLIGSRSGSQVSLFIGVPTDHASYSGFWGNGDIYLCNCFSSNNFNYDQLSSYNFVLTSNSSFPSSAPTSSNSFFVHSNIYSPCFAYKNPNSNMTGFLFDAKALFSFSMSYVPDYSDMLVGFPVSFQFDERDFYQWIIDNNKVSDLPNYIGTSKLLSFLTFYKSFGSSNSSFLKNISSWFSFMNIANQTNDNIIILKNAIDKLYQEYINQYKHEFYSNSANQAHHRRNIQTQTDDDDLTLVTDDQTDDIYTKLLREIIRGIIALQVTVSEGHRAIIDTLNNLDFTVAVSNNGGNFQFPDLEDLFTPTYSGFDDLEDQFFDKFPFLLDLKDLPEIEDYLEEEEQGDNLQVAAFSAGSEAVEVDPLKTRDDLFRFTVPENNNFMNGAVSGMSIDFASFTKFASAIEALKGIISVIALFGFSHWLIKFAPKLLHGYASSD